MVEGGYDDGINESIKIDGIYNTSSAMSRYEVEQTMLSIYSVKDYGSLNNGIDTLLCYSSWSYHSLVVMLFSLHHSLNIIQ